MTARRRRGGPTAPPVADLEPPPGTVAIGGRRPAMEAVAAGRAVRVLVAQDARGSILDELRIDADRAGVPMTVAAADALDRMGLGEHQGVASFVRLPPPLDDRALAGRTFGSDALVVVLDGITDPQNLGACARAGDAAGAELLVTRIRRAAAITASAVKASAGALVHLEVARVTNVTRSIEVLKDRGFTVVGLDAEGAATIHDQPPRRPLAIVVGSEGAGLSRLVRTSCDLLVRIPMAGHVGSLNAAAALAVALFGYAARSEA